MPESKPTKLPEPPSPSALFWNVATSIIKENTLVVAASVFLLFVSGGATVVWGQATFKSTVQNTVDAGLKEQKEKQAKTDARLDELAQTTKAALNEQKQTQARTEAKVDRLDARVEQLIDVVYEMRGRQPPPAPPLILGTDGGN